MAQYTHGITFGSQAVTPVNDGSLYAKLLRDCILNGMAVTYAGQNLFIAPGEALICGRMLGPISAITYATVSPTAEGYGRLKIVIDISRPASETAFEQAWFDLEYSTNQNFPALVQDDINNPAGGGTIYECAVATPIFSGFNILSVTKA